MFAQVAVTVAVRITRYLLLINQVIHLEYSENISPSLS